MVGACSLSVVPVIMEFVPDVVRSSLVVSVISAIVKFTSVVLGGLFIDVRVADSVVEEGVAGPPVSAASEVVTISIVLGGDVLISVVVSGFSCSVSLGVDEPVSISMVVVTNSAEVVGTAF